ncbi:hypothetical protein KKE34_04560 [Patescibacteria group bacterium]|nr:hypothetical protein [Patescibacteria group bacterium]MBU1885848.1 hypothetical protein [Patescibacteria group bacterium]
MISREEKLPLTFSRGVAAVLSYQGNLYGIPTQFEDQDNIEQLRPFAASIMNNRLQKPANT